MKWFFALNQASLTGLRDLWEPLITAAVSSAQQFTTLKPHLIFDGDSDPFLTELEGRGVTIVRHRVSFYDALAAHRSDPGYLTIASGAFLRVEIPLIETEDEYVLYTDCDVLFQGPVALEDIRPSYFACAPEFTKDDMVKFNTGVMIMNVKNLAKTLDEFTIYIAENLDKMGTFDQDAYRQFYGDKVEALPIEYNWKPYWGRSDTAVIVHFHGPKPSWGERLIANPDDTTVPTYHTIFHWNVAGYRYYVPRWRAASMRVQGAAAVKLT